MTGSTITHVNVVSAAALVCVLRSFESILTFYDPFQTSLALYHSVRKRNPRRSSLGLPLEWALLVFPLLLSMTLFAEKPGLLSVILVCLSFVVSFVPAHENKYESVPTDDLPPRPTSPSHSIDMAVEGSRRGSPTSSWSSWRIRITPLPALSTYRAHMMIMTILSILAVDFPVFPRSLAKCETFGVSLVRLHTLSGEAQS